MAGGDGEVMVANPYRADLAEQITRAKGVEHDCATALDDASRPMEAPAWVSSRADEFYAELLGQLRNLARAAEQTIARLQDEHDAAPAEVTPGSAKLYSTDTGY